MDARRCANARWVVDGMRGRRRIHAAGLEKFLGLVRGLSCCCGVAASCGSTLSGPTPLRPAGFVPARQWKFRRGTGLVMAGLRPAGFAKPPASMPARVTRKHQRSRGLLPRELDLPTLARPARMEASRARPNANDASCKAGSSHPVLKVGGKDAADRVVVHSENRGGRKPPANAKPLRPGRAAHK